MLHMKLLVDLTINAEQTIEECFNTFDYIAIDRFIIKEDLMKLIKLALGKY